MSGIVVRPVRQGEAGLVHGFIRELAEYERMLDKAVASVADIDAALFGENPRVFCDIAEMGGEGTEGRPVGFALWFYNFSTFQGRCGLYLEDLYVRPETRGRGAGKALLGRLAKRCVDENLGRMDWAVLDWNAPSIAFYDSLGAGALKDWIVRRLEGEALAALAQSQGRS